MRISAITTAAIAITLGVLRPQPALCWGDEGHEIVVLVAQAFLEPGVRSKVIGLLATDTDSLIPHDLASEATWADKYRDANRNGSRENTRRWHFVDIEISHSDLDGACFGHRPIPTGTVASNGPARDCVVDKVEEFAAELSNPATDPEERIVALKFLLHLVGDLHQPLHASDDNDRGGNDKPVVTPGLKAGNLHHFWDTEFVDRLGTNSRSIASDLIGHISKAQQQDWSQGTPADWAWESFQMVRQDAYGQLPAPSAHRSYLLTDDYVSMATRDVVVQLSKAGVPLAFLLNKALGRPPAKSELGLSPRQVFSCPR